jgi:hypothetical protein
MIHNNLHATIKRYPFRSLRRISFAGIMLIASLALEGCGGGSEAPATIHVSGVVTYKGSPLTKGTVTLQPVTGSGDALKRTSQGEIGADGHFELSTFTKGDGVLPGKYSVLVTSYLNDPTAEEYDQGAKRESAIPEKYSNALTSGLSKEIPAVPPEGNNGAIEYKIELTE